MRRDGDLLSADLNTARAAAKLVEDRAQFLFE